MEEWSWGEGEELVVGSHKEGRKEVPSGLGVHGLLRSAKAAVWSREARFTL